MSEQRPVNNNNDNEGSIAGSLRRFGPLMVIIAFAALFGMIGYLLMNAIGIVIGAILGQSASSDYLVSYVINDTVHQPTTAKVLQSLGAYYYMQALTLPNTYSLIGAFIGIVVGIVIGLHYIERKQ